MNRDTQATQTSTDLDTIAAVVLDHARQASGDPMELLRLLRFLEWLHQDIRSTLFQDSLPTTRQALYTLLREIEAQGGWPYIPRMQLRTLLEQLASAPPTSAHEDESE